jgi:ABC-type bacteriocin/lantibiotic exporter with double-glycine peptidase domain
MNLTSNFKFSLSLMDNQTKRYYFILSTFGVFLNFLDVLAAFLLVSLFRYFVDSKINLIGTLLPVKEENILKIFHSEKNFIIALSLFVIFLFLAKGLGNLLINYRLNLCLSKFYKRISVDYLNRLLKSNLLEIQKKSSQSVAFRLNQSLPQVCIEVPLIISQAFGDIVLAILFIVLLTITNLSLTLVLMMYFAIGIFFLSRFLSPKIESVSTIFAENQISSNQIIQESLEAFREIFVAQKIDQRLLTFALVKESYAKSSALRSIFFEAPQRLFEFMVGASTALISLILVLQNKTGAEVFSIISLVAIASARVIPALLRINRASFTLKSAHWAYENVRDLKWVENVQEPSSSVVMRTREKSSSFNPTVMIKDLSFSYPGKQKAALTGINLEIGAGESVGLVGQSGSGKSTLVDIMLGLLPPTHGQILVSGLPPRLALQEWHGQIRYVPQFTALLDLSIRENILLGSSLETEPDSTIMHILQSVNLEAWVHSQPEGLDSLIGERGAKMSGGQRQRLGIARALISNPRLLILDEATSSLDASNEKIVMEVITRLKGEITIISIAHRLSSLKNMDKIVYLEDSQIQAVGSFEEVRQNSSGFAAQASELGI